MDWPIRSLPRLKRWLGFDQKEIPDVCVGISDKINIPVKTGIGITTLSLDIFLLYRFGHSCQVEIFNSLFEE